MGVFSVLYISRPLIQSPEADLAVAEIVRVARERNGSLGVTGALLFTGERFAQVLEGTRAAVKDLMVSINGDARHTDVVVIREEQVSAARFARWTLAYSGPAAFVDRTLVRTLQEALVPGRLRGDRLMRLLTELSSGR